MRAILRATVAAAALWPTGPASPAELADMVGRRTWQKYTIEVKECAGNRLCAKVLSGPKNVGMEIFASALTGKGGEWLGQVGDPETKAVFDTRLSRKNADLWRLEGCAPSGLCLSGEFVRAK